MKKKEAFRKERKRKKLFGKKKNGRSSF